MEVVLKVVVFSLFLTQTVCQEEGDAIKGLPGWDGPLPTKQYSGFLEVGNNKVHYWLVESESDPANDPLVLWYNGGPPCSSLVGSFGELGPFLARPGSERNQTNTFLIENEGRWNKRANLLFIESPLGVGFTFSTKETKTMNKTELEKLYAANDTTTAELNFASVYSFFKKYPDYLKHSFYVAGESYAGIYVPMLAQQIVKHNALEEADMKIPIKGMLVGNGALATGDWYEGWLTKLRMENVYSKGLISPQYYKKITETCTNYSKNEITPECQDLLNGIANRTGPLNVYDLRETCLTNNNNNNYVKDANEPLTTGTHSGSNMEDPCSLGGPELISYLNQPDTQKAINVGESLNGGNWNDCGASFGRPVVYTRVPQDERVTVYPDLINTIKILIYNGDQDNCIPYMQDEAWTAGLGLKVVKDWHPWNVDEQVAGYAVEYSEMFTFTTVKDAGHLCPRTFPSRAFAMFDRFVNDIPL
eukprot:m.144350 g.144350  ORF g.144350 m.144350 type:complete len:475 (+) comp14917_c0_seq4:46-1470(+)